jgi:very-short-patch-repair endonuclease
VIVAGELVDFFWPDARLIVETDGYGFHRGRTRFEADRRRDARLLVAGFRVLRVTQRRIEREPQRVVWEAGAAAGRGGLMPSTSRADLL